MGPAIEIFKSQVSTNEVLFESCPLIIIESCLGVNYLFTEIEQLSCYWQFFGKEVSTISSLRLCGCLAEKVIKIIRLQIFPSSNWKFMPLIGLNLERNPKL